MRRFLLLLPLLWLALASPVAAQQPLTGRATLTGEGLTLIERRGRVLVSLDISQPVPWRVFTLDAPWRVVLDFSEVDWSGAGARPDVSQISRIDEVATGIFRPGWSRQRKAMSPSPTNRSCTSRPARYCPWSGSARWSRRR